MIVSGDGTVLISSLGWVEGDALWLFQPTAGQEARVTFDSGARYVSLHCCDPSHFAVAHHFDGSRFEITVRTFSNPEGVIARGWLAPGGSSLEGDPDAWRFVPRLYVEYLNFEPHSDFVLLTVLPAAGRIDAQRLRWYDDTYDKGYQGVIGVLELPDEGQALIAVQRDSRLVLHDLATGQSRRKIALLGRGGNPRMLMRRNGELWADDYDSIAVLDTDGWKVLRSARLQAARADTQQFIGEYAFDRHEALCAVARPFTGDVIAIEPETLKVVSAAKVGGQPLEVALLGEGQVVARDWKSGRVLRGRLEHRRRRFPV